MQATVLGVCGCGVAEAAGRVLEGADSGADGGWVVEDEEQGGGERRKRRR